MMRFLSWIITGSSCWHRWDKTLTHGMEFGTERRCQKCGDAEVLMQDDGGWSGAYWGKNG